MSAVEGSYLVIVEVEVDELGKLSNTVVKVILGMSDWDGSNVLVVGVVVIREYKSVAFVVSVVLVKVEGLNAGIVESEVEEEGKLVEKFISVVLIEPIYEGSTVVLIDAEVAEIVNLFDKDVSVLLDKAEVVIVVELKDDFILDDTLNVWDGEAVTMLVVEPDVRVDDIIFDKVEVCLVEDAVTVMVIKPDVW